MTDKRLKQNQRLSGTSKNANSKQWYKDQADMLDTEHNTLGFNHSGVSEYKRMKVNYDLFNNILNLKDFEYVCQPFGANAGQLPATMSNRDISSGKIKAILGMEMKRPFSWKVVATNPEATTRKETEKFERIKQYVVDQIMQPIREQAQMQAEEQQRGRQLTEEEKAQIRQQVAQQTQSMTPPEVANYMEREHQDPAEVLSHQLLEYLVQKLNLSKKFNDAYKHAMLSAKEILYVGILNGEPQVWNTNSLRFNSDSSPDLQFVEDGEWATCEYRMKPSEVIQYFGDELSQKEIDDIYESYAKYRVDRVPQRMFQDTVFMEEGDADTIRVLHCVWKSLEKVGFLTYVDETGEEQLMTVGEDYKLNTKFGDLDIDWAWIPKVYETWKIGTDIYKRMQPLPGQFKDIDNMYHCKLPYYGAIYDNMNSQPTSLMDRLKVFQYYYNIVMYRLELMLASDKGKKVLMNINAIPEAAGMPIEDWKYFFESTPFTWFNPDEEGMQYADVNNIAKVLDLSLASDIGKYIEIAQYLKQQAGESVGITPQIEGQIGPNDAVTNTRQAIIQSSHILEPYFELHNHVKRNVLQALLECAKVAYSGSKKKTLTYVLDDLSIQTLNIDVGLLDNSTLGLFVSNSSKAEEAKQTIRQLAHAALQNQKIELSDVVSIIRQEGIVEAEETLKVAENNRKQYEQQMQESNNKSQMEMQERQRQFEREKMQHEKEMAVLKEEEKRKTEVQKAAIMGMSFNPETDRDEDGENDFLELARDGLDADIKLSRQQLDREKFEHQRSMDKEKLSLERQKLKEKKTPSK